MRDEEESEEEALHRGSLQTAPLLAWKNSLLGLFCLNSGYAWMLRRCIRIKDGSGGEWRLDDFLVGKSWISTCKD